MCHDLHQAKLGESQLAECTHHGCHDTTAPVRFRQPVTDFRSVRFAKLKVVESTAADQRTFLVPDGSLDGSALLLRRLFHNLQPFLKMRLRVREGNAQGVVVDFLFLEVLHASGLVGRLKFGKVDLGIDNDFHGRVLILYSGRTPALGKGSKKTSEVSKDFGSSLLLIQLTG